MALTDAAACDTLAMSSAAVRARPLLVYTSAALAVVAIAVACFATQGTAQPGSPAATDSAAALSWTSESLPSGTWADAISCPTATDCMGVAVGGIGQTPPAVGTTNAGQSWTPRDIPATFGISGRISCATTSDCEVAGRFPNPANASQALPAMLGTTDGGETWVTQPGPSSLGPQYAPFLGVSCPTASDCFASGGNGEVGTDQAIAATTDGGATWTAQNVPTNNGTIFDDISCPTTTTCYAAGNNEGLYSGGSPGPGSEIVKSTDGGSTWVEKTIPATIPDLNTTAPYMLDAIACPTVNVCFAGGTSFLSDYYASPLLMTIDGGAHWTGIALVLTMIAAIACTSATDCVLVGWTQSSGDGTTTTPIYQTTDGTTWFQDAAPASVSDIASVSCPASGVCYAGGGSANGPVALRSFSPAEEAPTVTGVAPSTGPPKGGAQVTIAGTKFSAGATVAFGTQAATAVTVDSATQITATSPPGAGTVDVTVTTGFGTSATSAADLFAYVARGVYTALPPARLCDTRSGQPANQCSGKTLGPAATDVVAVAGQEGVPKTGATAVVVNVTAVGATASTYLTVYPDGRQRPLASSLNVNAGENVPNLVTVALPEDGEIDVYNAAGRVDLIVDVEGFYAAPSSPGTGLYNALSPQRICDTRPSGQPSNQCTGKAPQAGKSLSVQVAGKGGVPSTGVAAVVVNVTAIASPTPGYLTVYPAGSSKPNASNVNYRAGEIVPNRVMMPLGSGGAIEIFSGNGTPNVAVDVSGYFTDSSDPTASGTEFTPAFAPSRICDTRSQQPANQCTGKTLLAATTDNVAAGSAQGVPPGATAAVLNVTSADATTGGYFTVYPPSDASPPVASDLNFSAGDAVANMVVATLAGGSFDVYNARGSTDLIVDLVGWYS